MSFDEQEFGKAFFGSDYSDKYKKAFSKGGGGNRFPYLPTSKLLPGVYKFRALPPMPEKCPEGWLRVALHQVPHTIGEEKPPRVVCIRTDEDACAMCDILESTAGDLDRLPKEIREVLERMIVNAMVTGTGEVVGGGSPKLVIPVVLGAEPEKPSDPKTKWKKSDKENGAMFEIYSPTLMKKYFTLMTADKYLSHETKGRYMAFIKKDKNTDIDLPAGSKPGPLTDPDIIKSYPNVVNAYLKNAKKFNYEEQNAFLEECWWMSDEKLQDILQSNYYDDPEEVTETAGEDLDIPW